MPLQGLRENDKIILDVQVGDTQSFNSSHKMPSEALYLLSDGSRLSGLLKTSRVLYFLTEDPQGILNLVGIYTVIPAACLPQGLLSPQGGFPACCSFVGTKVHSRE